MIAAQQIFMGAPKSGGHQVEYIDFGGYYFETDFKPNNNTTFEAEFAYLHSESDRGQVVFGTRDDWQRAAFIYPPARPADLSVWLQWGNAAKNVRLPSVSLLQKYQIGVNTSRSFLWQGTTLWTPSAATFQCSYPFVIGETFSGGSPIETIFNELRLYRCKIWDNGTLCLDLVPWVNGDNIGLRDVLNGNDIAVKLANAQTYPRYITAGPNITANSNGGGRKCLNYSLLLRWRSHHARPAWKEAA